MSGFRTSLVASLFLACAPVGFAAAGVVDAGEVNGLERHASKPGDVFEIDGKVAAAGLLTTPDASGARPTRLDHNSAMLRLLDGRIAEIDRRTLSMLRRFAQDSASVGTAAAHVATLHLLSDDGQDAMLELLDDGSDSVWARRADGTGLVTLPRVRLDALVPGWDRHESGGVSSELPRGEIVALPGPYVEGSVKLDPRTVRERLNGTDATYPSSGLTRKLEKEEFWIRLPSGFEANRPSGVMIWVSPMPKWRIPPHFNKVLDELGLIACGVDNAGNDRNVTERLQLQFDVLETVRSRYALDEKRLYVTGFSGGGRCSSMLLMCWPEVFAGAVPIVGLNSYHRLDAQEPGKFIRAQVGHPEGRRLDLVKARRFWAFTGETDMNRYEMETRTERLTFDGFAIKCTTVPGIGHDMPPAAELQDAVRWVDEPRREAIALEQTEASAAMHEYEKTLGGGGPLTDHQRAALVEITRKWPWTESAWEAAERLGYERPGD